MQGVSKAERITQRQWQSRLREPDPPQCSVPKQPCWKCGQHMAKKLVFGYPVCLACDTPDFDPEEMEMVIMESLKAGRLVALNSILEKA